MTNRMDPAIKTAQSLVDAISRPDDLDVDERIALAQAYALISIAKSLDGLDQRGINVSVMAMPS